MYAKPHTRALDATIAHASCTPCDGRFSGQTRVIVGVGYSQVAGRGFCAPPGVTGPTLVNVDLASIIKVGGIHFGSESELGVASVLLP